MNRYFSGKTKLTGDIVTGSLLEMFEGKYYIVKPANNDGEKTLAFDNIVEVQNVQNCIYVKKPDGIGVLLPEKVCRLVCYEVEPDSVKSADQV